MARRNYDKQFKMAAVKLVLEDDMTVAEVSKELSIHYNTLYRRISEYEEYGESAFPGLGTALYSYQYEIKNREPGTQKEIRTIKKILGLLEEKECVRFRYIKEHVDSLNIKRACKILNVSRSGYYKYLECKPSSRDIENEVLSAEIKKIFEEHKGRYGSLRISKVLEQNGIKVNRKRVARLMRLMGLYSKGT